MIKGKRIYSIKLVLMVYLGNFKLSCLLVTHLKICKRECWEERKSQGTGGLTKK